MLHISFQCHTSKYATRQCITIPGKLCPASAVRRLMPGATATAAAAKNKNKKTATWFIIVKKQYWLTKQRHSFFSAIFYYSFDFWPLHKYSHWWIMLGKTFLWTKSCVFVLSTVLLSAQLHSIDSLSKSPSGVFIRHPNHIVSDCSLTAVLTYMYFSS